MKPAPFDYLAPASIEEAVDWLGDLVAAGEDVKLLAGGQSLMPLLNMRLARPRYVIDLNSLQETLGGIEVQGAELWTGSLVRHFQLEQDARLGALAPILPEAERWIGHPAIRSRGTVGGSLVHADPAAELPAVAVLLGATLTARSPRGMREISARDLYLTYMTTILDPDELVTGIKWPGLGPRAGQCLIEHAERHGDFALALAACQITLGPDGRVVEAGLVLGGVGPVPVDASHVVSGLMGERAEEGSIQAAAEALRAVLTPEGDLHASAAYRLELAVTLARRAITTAAARAASRGERP
jgi:carbon-monoxide dehydrogenase medium subunit